MFITLNELWNTVAQEARIVGIYWKNMTYDREKWEKIWFWRQISSKDRKAGINVEKNLVLLQ